MKAAVYIRKSRESNDKPSYRLAVQREKLPAYAAAQGWHVEIYDDGHASAARGKVEDLPERARLQKDINAGRIGVILVIELSRLSRDDTMQDYIAWLTLCADHGVKLATLTRTLDPSQNSDWMLLLMEGGFSSVEMKMIAGRMKEGRRQAFLSGKFLGGNCPPPYTYDKAEKKPIIDVTLLPDCEKIWTLCETMSAKAVAEHLGLAEITVRRSISDDRLLFYQALRQDKETGELIQCEWDPVMSESRAERIRAARRTRKTNTTRREAAGLLTALGIFYCGYCGKTVKSWNNSKIRKDGTRLDYYACTTKNKKGVCPKSKMIDHQTVNEKVLKNIFYTLANVEELKRFWLMAEEENSSAGKAEEIRELIAKEEKKKKNLVEAISERLLEFEDAKEKMDSIKSNLAALNNQLDQLQSAPDEPDWESLNITQDKFEHMNFATQRKVIASVLEAITIYNSYMILNYRCPRTESGSYDARVNLLDRPQKKKKGGIRSRSHLAKVASKNRVS